MYKLRIWIGVLIWWLFLFYNIERITEPINIDSYVYVFVPLAAGVLIMVPRIFRRISLVWYILFAIIMFLVAKQLFAPPLVGYSLPLLITGIAFLTVTLLLARRVAEIVWDFEDTISNLTFQQLGLAPRMYETTETEDLYREVKRSRRYQHPLALMALRPEYDPDMIKLNPLMEDLQRTMANRYVQARMARLLSEELRDIDLVAIDEEVFYVLLPETTTEEGIATAERLARQVQEQLKIDVVIGQASFPDEAITLGGLLDTARARLTNGDKAPPRAEPLEKRPLARKQATDNEGGSVS